MQKIIPPSVSFETMRDKTAPGAEIRLPDALQATKCRTPVLPIDQDFHLHSNSQEFKVPVAKLQSRVECLVSQLASLKDIRSRSPPPPYEACDWLVEVQKDFLQGVAASLYRLQSKMKSHDEQDSKINDVDALSERNFLAKDSENVREDIRIADVTVAGTGDKTIDRCPIPFHIPDLPRPQDKFDEAVDNSNTPFKHRVKRRRSRQELLARYSQDHQCSVESVCLQHSGGSLALQLAPALDKQASRCGVESSVQDVHPYEEDLSKMAYVKGLMDSVEIREYKSPDSTPFTFIATLPALKEMVYKLQMSGEVAVDLENHHYRSFQGFVCLMQVSTCDEDFVVDTIDLRSHIGPCLGDIFSDPTIRKVMHGAEHDIVWLQRDFGIYVCNLFDTGQAARVLQLPGSGLAFLLEHFCGVHTDKRYQLADWRIRPLPPEMLKYARDDTHYLLYLHDILKQKLLNARHYDGTVDDKDPCFQVYKRSRDLCLQLYSKDIYSETSFKQLCGFQEKKYTPEQLAVLAALYAWRDQIARKEDESTGYVLPNQLLFQLASEMPDSVLLLQSFLKATHMFVGHHASTVVEVIRQAREKSKTAYLDSCHEHEVHKHTVSQNEEVAGDVLQGDEVASVNSFGEEIYMRSQIDGKKAETRMFSTKLQTDNLVSTSIISKSLEEDRIANFRECISRQVAENIASEVGCELGLQHTKDAVSEVGHGTGHLELTLENLSPVISSRGPESDATVPFLSPHVSTSYEFVHILEAPNRPTVCLVLPTVNSVNSDSPTDEESVIEHRSIASWDEGWALEQEKDRKRLDSIPMVELEDTSTKLQTGIDGCEEAGSDRSGPEETSKIKYVSWWSPMISARWSRSNCQIF